MFCVNCQKEIDPDLVTGADIYGPLTFNKSEPFARCPHCGNYGEFAIDREPPFSVIPTAELRKAYNYIDATFQCLWMQKKMTKAEAEAKMAELMYNGERPYRTHEIRTRDEAIKAYRFAKYLYKEFISNATKNS